MLKRKFGERWSDFPSETDTVVTQEKLDWLLDHVNSGIHGVVSGKRDRTTVTLEDGVEVYRLDSPARTRIAYIKDGERRLTGFGSALLDAHLLEYQRY